MENFNRDESDLSTDEESSGEEDVGYVVADYEDDILSTEELNTESGESSLTQNGQSRNEDTGQRFDPVLASRHTYLGTNWEEVQGRTILDEDAVYEIPLLQYTAVVPVPGHTIPLTIFHESTASMLRRVIQGNRMFGLISESPIEAEGPSSVLGVTAEIFEYCDDVESGQGLKIKAKGRQRFIVIEPRRQVDGNLMGKVKILPETNLRDSLYECRLNSLDRYRTSTRGKKQIYRKQYLVPLTAWPAWVHAQYDSQLLTERIIKTVRLNDSTIQLPTDPEELSYWLTQNLPLEDEHRLLLLRKESTVQRLRCALGFLEHCKMLCCKECGHVIARQNDIFCMTQEGSQSAFVNPAGFVHDTLTLTKAKGIRVTTSPSAYFSWFPGYGWSCAECSQCQNHMGWLFTAMSDNLRPLKFWGLTRRSLKPCFQMEEGDQKIKIVM